MVATMAPLDARIDPRIKCKIWQDMAVNLLALIKIQSDESAMQSVGIDGQGNLMIQNQPKGKIANIVQWNEAWRVFMVIALKNPAISDHQRAQLALDMIQYMQLINQLNHDNADWSFYDENFRLFKQYNQISFSSVDYELKSRAVARTNNMARWQQKYKKPQRPIQPKQNSLVAEAKGRLSRFLVPMGYCKLFLASLPCYERTCPYIHSCLWCNQQHSAYACHKPALRGGQQNQAPPMVSATSAAPRPPYQAPYGNLHSRLSATLSEMDRHSTTSEPLGVSSIIIDSPDQRLWADVRWCRQHKMIWCLPCWSVTSAWTRVLCLSSILRNSQNCSMSTI